MALSGEEVARIALLARLRLSEQEQELYAEQLGAIVDYIDQLGKYQTLPEVLGTKGTREAEDRPRPMTPEESDEATRRYIANAPDHLDTFFMVPQVKGD